LRPFNRERNNDGMPRLVRKYARFPPHCQIAPRPSVFQRLGWNPTFVLARQRVRQARQYFWRRQQFYPPRVSLSVATAGLFAIVSERVTCINRIVNFVGPIILCHGLQAILSTVQAKLLQEAILAMATPKVSETCFFSACLCAK